MHDLCDYVIKQLPHVAFHKIIMSALNKSRNVLIKLGENSIKELSTEKSFDDAGTCDQRVE